MLLKVITLPEMDPHVPPSQEHQAALPPLQARASHMHGNTLKLFTFIFKTHFLREVCPYDQCIHLPLQSLSFYVYQCHTLIVLAYQIINPTRTKIVSALTHYRTSLMAQMVRNPQCRRAGFDPRVGKSPWRKEWLPTPVFLAWRIPRTEEPEGLQSMRSQRVITTE